MFYTQRQPETGGVGGRAPQHVFFIILCFYILLNRFLEVGGGVGASTGGVGGRAPQYVILYNFMFLHIVEPFSGSRRGVWGADPPNMLYIIMTKNTHIHTHTNKLTLRSVGQRLFLCTGIIRLI